MFHTDTSYVDAPPAFMALRAVEVPESGGETLFSDQVAVARDGSFVLRRVVPGDVLLQVAAETMRRGDEMLGVLQPDSLVLKHWRRRLAVGQEGAR